jgi:formylglycine-generating enzyme required for sulfatase activity
MISCQRITQPHQDRIPLLNRLTLAALLLLLTGSGVIAGDIPAGPAKAVEPQGIVYDRGTLDRVAIQLRHLSALKQSVDAEQRQYDVLRQQIQKSDPKNATDLQVQAARLERALLLKDPDMAGVDRILFVRRKGGENFWNHFSCLAAIGPTSDALCVLTLSTGAVETLYETELGIFDVNLHWDGNKVLFSSRNESGKKGTWAVWEFDLTTRAAPRRVSPFDEKDVHWMDACYLPNDEIILAGTAAFSGVPCVGGINMTCNLYRLDPKSGRVRQLTFDQDVSSYPMVRQDGQIMYIRWEYMDTPHQHNRQLFTMRPDGSVQRSLFGSNMVWPTSMDYPKDIPNEPGKIITIVSGHHTPRVGDLVLLDMNRGGGEARAAVAFFNDPSRRDGFVPSPDDNINWDGGGINNKFVHPWPLSSQRILASTMGRRETSYSLVFVSRPVTGDPDLVMPLLNFNGRNCLQPIPLLPRRRPPVIPDMVDLNQDFGIVMVQDVYQGKGLEGIPRGIIKSLRLIEPYYLPFGGAKNFACGVAGPWDCRRIVGTVPVEEDGSASWKAPANVPLAIQALDAEGKAVAIMRSWYTVMPGEKISCVGCHERANDVVKTSKSSQAPMRTPSDIRPWYGPARGFSFVHEVQPVLDRFCVGCHDGSRPDRSDFRPSDKLIFPNIWGQPTTFVQRGKPPATVSWDTAGWGFPKVSPAYYALQAYVHRPGPESNIGLPLPMEWHADTSDLIQMLKAGHHGVVLDAESWDRLITWIDMNVPFHGNYGGSESLQRRHELWTKYAKARPDLEVLPPTPAPVAFQAPKINPNKPDQNLSVRGWPFSAETAAQKIKETITSRNHKPELICDLGEGVTLRLVLIPAGSFVMGSREGYDNEYPCTEVKIAEPFYLGVAQVNNEQYARFDQAHDSGYLSQYGYGQFSRGLSARNPKQPVIRVSWNRARAFCTWLKTKTGLDADLPTEAQWEWACRAGTATPMWYGGTDQPWVEGERRFDNLADSSIKGFLIRGGEKTSLFMPHNDKVNDLAAGPVPSVGAYCETWERHPIAIPATGFVANPFGLLNMHGNVRHWTRSLLRPYPYRADDGREDIQTEGVRVVRGGSFYDLPNRATSSFRIGYPSWMRPWNVGFRVMVNVPVPGKSPWRIVTVNDQAHDS